MQTVSLEVERRIIFVGKNAFNGKEGKIISKSPQDGTPDGFVYRVEFNDGNKTWADSGELLVE